MDWDQRFRADDAPWERKSLHPVIEDWKNAGAFTAGMRGFIPGCGRAPELLHLATAGLDMTAADISNTALEWQDKALKAEKLKAKLVSGDAFEFKPEAPFDIIFEQTFLCAIPPKLRELYETSVFNWLKPGGKLLALFMQKDEMGGPPYACPIPVMRKLFPESRWIWPDEAELVAYPHPRLNDKKELAGILVRR